MDSPAGFAVVLVAVTAGMVLVGIPLLKSLTLAIEGHKEFKGDSLTRRERTQGWIGAVVWAVFAIVVWSFFADWFRAGNLEYARDALSWRIENIIYIASRH